MAEETVVGTSAVADTGTDTPVADATETITDTGTDTTSTEEETPSTEGDQTTEGSQDGEGDRAGEPSVEDGRVIPQWIRSLKETDAKAYGQARSNFFDLRARTDIHKTVDAARQDRDLIQSLGGSEGVEKLQQDAGFFSEAAKWFMDGSPEFVKDLWQEDPIAAALHVSPMLEQFKEKDSEGYKSTIAKVWQNDFKAVNFGPGVKSLIAAIESGDKATAAQIAKEISEWHDSIIGVANRAEDPRVKSLLAERNRERQTKESTERQEFVRTYQTETANSVMKGLGQTFDSFFRGYKLDREDRVSLLRDAERLVSKQIIADKAFIEKREAALNRGDAHSAKSMTEAKYKQLGTDAVKSIARRYGMFSNTKPKQQNPQQQQRPGSSASPGYVAINAPPKEDQINRVQTSREMIIERKAILKDGRKVDWSKSVRSQV